MNHKPMHDPTEGRLRVACFASGSGTNARKIIERSLKPYSLYEVVLVFSDVRDSQTRRSGGKMSKAKDIAVEYGIGYECEDIRDFYKEKGVPRRDLTVRPEFDERVLEKITPYDLGLICNAGYMTIMTPPILETYSGRIINVHPADLTVIESGERKYVGIHVVEEAIMAGEKKLRSSTHIVREKVDHGEILVLSEPISVELPNGVTLKQLEEDKALRNRVVDEYQERLKKMGDWVIYPLTVQLIAEGRFSLGSDGVYFDGEKAPHGVKLPL